MHADRRSSMTAKPVAFLLADLGITKSHSRPYVSNDNPYSESQLGTLKYQPDFPDRFGSLEAARASSCWQRGPRQATGSFKVPTGSLLYTDQQPRLLRRHSARVPMTQFGSPRCSRVG